jgi:hypothetical protein
VLVYYDLIGITGILFDFESRQQMIGTEYGFDSDSDKIDFTAMQPLIGLDVYMDADGDYLKTMGAFVDTCYLTKVA